MYGNQMEGRGSIPWPTLSAAATTTLLMDPPNPNCSGNVVGCFVPGSSRKRSRDSTMLTVMAAPPPPPPPLSAGVSNCQQQCMPPVAAGGDHATAMGDAISLQIMQQQWEMDRLISSHAEKVRLEMSERIKSQTRRIVAAIEAAVAKRLRDKEQEVIKMGRVSQALEEKVKSLSMENQIWRDLALANEATANALRSNLERLLSSSQPPNRSSSGNNCVAFGGEELDEAESCCGSSGDGGHEGETEVEEKDGQWKKVSRRRRRTWCEDDGGGGGGGGRSSSSGRIIMCRKCGMVESSVLLLPCRHLCVCTGCGSASDACPVCNSAKCASVRVNFS